MSTTDNKAAWLPAPKTYPLEVGPAPMPTPEGTEVVVQVHSGAINPADPAVQKLGIVVQLDNYPYILCTDIAGIVTAVGPANTRFKPGDRVTALCIPSLLKDSKYGGFQLYAVVVEPLIARIPERISFNEGCVVGLGLATAAYSLFSKNALALDLPRPGGNEPNGKILLVWGGASSVGACGIQAAKAAGYTIAATASAKNFELLREIGAEYVFDYTSATVVDDIVAALAGKGEMAGVFCAIGSPAVLAQCAAVIGRLEGRKHVGTVRPPGFPPLDGWPEGIEVSDCASTHIVKNEVGRAIWGEWLEGALADGSMKCRPHYEVVGKGLEGVQGGLDVMSKGVSAKKLVVEIVY
ncbi:zinc-binding oxidoreductase CipB [Mycena capillaripes]|nr:zinc-binding oxidoreductase CipB [Mycena capillaripes]